MRSSAPYMGVLVRRDSGRWVDESQVDRASGPLCVRQCGDLFSHDFVFFILFVSYLLLF